jgi:hypothetical protein
MLQRPSRSELKRARQQRWRQRPDRGVIHVAGDVPTVLVEALINSHVLDPQAAENKQFIMYAMVRLPTLGARVDLDPYSAANSGRCLGSEFPCQHMRASCGRRRADVAASAHEHGTVGVERTICRVNL